MKNKKIFVTGATGFIGSNLVRELENENYEVHILIKENSNTKLIEDIINRLHIFEYKGDTRSFN